MEDCYFVYILASKRNGTLYIGMTSDLLKRVDEHRKNLVKGFTAKYQVHRLIYFESIDDFDSALLRERQLKTWKRSWKLRLIEEQNPNWDDLYKEILDPSLRWDGKE